jgi:hypothetical protein
MYDSKEENFMKVEQLVELGYQFDLIECSAPFEHIAVVIKK